MNIAHLSTSVTLNQTVFNQMIYQKHKQGHRVVAICPDDEWTVPIKKEGIEVIDVPFLRHNLVASLTSAMYQTWAVCRKEKFDVVHTHTLLPGISGRIAARLAGIPAVIHTFHLWQLHLDRSPAFIVAFNTMELIAAHAAHALLFQNSDDMHSWLAIPGVPAHKATLVGNGIDFTSTRKKADPDARRKIRQEFGIAEDTSMLVMVGRFEEQKGHSFLLKVLKYLSSQTNYKIVTFLVGNGENKEKIEFEATEMGLQGDIIFTGYRLDVPNILAASDISIMTSHFEGVPRALMESMALGLPVVATDVPGTRTLVQQGITGLLAEYGNVQGMANALIQVISDAEFARRLGENGKLRVQTKFNEYVVADRVSEIYSHILNNGRKPLPHWGLDAGRGKIKNL